MNRDKDLSEYTIFWQIDFRVVAAQIRLTQTVSLWRIRPDATPVRIDSQKWHLSHRKVGAGTLRIAQDHIECDNAGLECLTVSLEEAIKTLAVSLEKRRLLHQIARSKSAGVSSTIGKENVSVRAVVDIPTSDAPHKLPFSLDVDKVREHPHGEIPLPTDPNRFHPIFFIDQPAGYILLGEAEHDGDRHTVWTIDQFEDGSKDGFPIDQLRGSTTAYQLDGWHTVRVHQDGERLAEGDYFEFWVDQLPLGHIPLNNPDFPFNRLPTRFYIGAYPSESDRNDLHCIKGKIKSLFFDPNDVCHSCFQ